MDIAFLILAHEKLDLVLRNIHRINIFLDSKIYVHVDEKVSDDEYGFFVENKPDNVYVLKKRLNCNWGGGTLVKATFLLIDMALKNRTDYLYLISGACYPLENLKNLPYFLKNSNKKNFIEVQGQSWIKSGIREDRYRKFFFLPKMKFPKLVRYIYLIQKKFRVNRNIPKCIQDIKFGSQWFCISSILASKISEYYKNNDLEDFFKYVYIPDECCIQTLSAQISSETIESRCLTYCEFDQMGKAKEFDIDALQCFEGKFFFVRKVY